jgi:hypothetical protein
LDDIIILLESKYGENKQSIQSEIVQENLLPTNKKILRNISNEISIRKGKYGKSYVYYKTVKMNTPLFIPLNQKDKLWWKKCSIVEFMEWFNTLDKKTV